jgi:hypothetical protein
MTEPNTVKPDEAVSAEKVLQPWHLFWNPLELDKTAEPSASAFETFKLFLYFFKSAISDKVLACTPLLVLCGDPQKSSIVFWFLIGAIAVFGFMFTLFHIAPMKSKTGLSFFKVTLYSEWLREHIAWKIISVMMVGWFFLFLALMWKTTYDTKQKCLRANVTCTEPSIAGVNFMNLSDDAPQYPSITFFILIAAFFKEIYNIVTYGDVFDDEMFPSRDFVREHIAGAYKNADARKFFLPNYPSFVNAPFQFEPNLPITPDGFMWILTDSATHLRSVMLICGFINAQMLKMPSTDKTITVEKFRADHMKTDTKLEDGSLPFEYGTTFCLYHFSCTLCTVTSITLFQNMSSIVIPFSLDAFAVTLISCQSKTFSPSTSFSAMAFRNLPPAPASNLHFVHQRFKQGNFHTMNMNVYVDGHGKKKKINVCSTTVKPCALILLFLSAMKHNDFTSLQHAVKFSSGQTILTFLCQCVQDRWLSECA